MLPLPPSPPTTEELTPTQLESSSRGTSATVPLSVEPTPENAEVETITPLPVYKIVG